MATNKELGILLLNADGITKRMNELTVRLSKGDVDIFCVNETKLSDRKTVGFPGFHSITHSRTNRGGGGVAIFVRDTIYTDRFSKKTIDLCEIATVDVKLRSRNVIRIVTVYCPPMIPLSDRALDFLVLGKRTIICGDLNAKHTAFGCRTTNSNGIALLQTIKDRKLTMLSTGEPTHLSTLGTLDQLDVFLCSEALAKFVSPPVVLSTHGSDHNSVRVTYGDLAAIHRREFYPPTRRVYSKANWDLYQVVRDINLPEPVALESFHSPHQLDEFHDCIVKAIDAGSEAGIPVVPAQDLKITKSSPLIRESLTRRNKLRRLVGKYNLRHCRQALYRCNHEIDSLYEEQKVQWTLQKNKDAQSKASTAPRVFHQSISSVMSNTAATPIRELTTIVTPTLEAYTPEEKCTVFAEHFEEVFKPREDLGLSSQEERVFSERERLVEGLPAYQLSFPPSSEQIKGAYALISEGDIVRTINHLKTTSPGNDNIHNTLLRRFSHQLILCLACLFRAVLATGYVPKSWRHADLVLIPKPGKDPSSTKGYRPISLICTIAKLFDRIANYRIRTQLSDAQYFCDEQSGFRTLHGCPDHLYRLSRDGYSALQQGKECTVISLDIEAAFDTVPHPDLRAKIHEAPLDSLWKRYLSENLRNRTFRVRIGGSHSQPKIIRAGVPQGGVSSPTIFIIYTNDLFGKITDSLIRKGALADDVLLWIVGYKSPAGRLAVKYRIEETLEQVSAWYKANRLKLNVAKTQALRISLAKPDNSVKIVFDGATLNWED